MPYGSESPSPLQTSTNSAMKSEEALMAVPLTSEEPEPTSGPVVVPLSTLGHRRSSQRPIKRKKWFDDEHGELDEAGPICTGTDSASGGAGPRPARRGRRGRRSRFSRTDPPSPAPSSAGIPEVSTSGSQSVSADDAQIGRWKPSDDLALILSVQQTGDLRQVHLGVTFSCHFNLTEIRGRWRALLFDPHVSALAVAAMRQLNAAQIDTIERRLLFSAAEERLLSACGSADSQPSLEQLQMLLHEHVDVFHSSRTPHRLLTHWCRLREYRLLDCQLAASSFNNTAAPSSSCSNNTAAPSSSSCSNNTAASSSNNTAAPSSSCSNNTATSSSSSCSNNTAASSSNNTPAPSKNTAAHSNNIAVSSFEQQPGESGSGVDWLDDQLPTVFSDMEELVELEVLHELLSSAADSHPDIDTASSRRTGGGGEERSLAVSGTPTTAIGVSSQAIVRSEVAAEDDDNDEDLVRQQQELADYLTRKQIDRLRTECHGWQVMVDHVTGVSSSEFDSSTLAVFRGRTVRYLMRSAEVTLGRGSFGGGGGDHEDGPVPVDIDLSLEGPAGKVSRLQAVVRLLGSGEFRLVNVGRRPVLIDGCCVACEQQCRLSDNCVVEVAGLRLLFLVHHRLVNTVRDKCLAGFKSTTKPSALGRSAVEASALGSSAVGSSALLPPKSSKSAQRPTATSTPPALSKPKSTSALVEPQPDTLTSVQSAFVQLQTRASLERPPPKTTSSVQRPTPIASLPQRTIPITTLPQRTASITTLPQGPKLKTLPMRPTLITKLPQRPTTITTFPQGPKLITLPRRPTPVTTLPQRTTPTTLPQRTKHITTLPRRSTPITLAQTNITASKFSPKIITLAQPQPKTTSIQPAPKTIITLAQPQPKTTSTQPAPKTITILAHPQKTVAQPSQKTTTLSQAPALSQTSINTSMQPQRRAIPTSSQPTTQTTPSQSL